MTSKNRPSQHLIASPGHPPRTEKEASEIMRDSRERSVRFARLGINVFPGSGDDHWTAPQPVALADGNTVQLWKDGQSLLGAISAIKAARRRILLETYIFAPDETGFAFAAALTEAAQRGVKVFVLVDGFGSMLIKDQLFDRMRAGGVRVSEFHPFLPWRVKYGWKFYNRDHRKLIVVDNDVAGMGGLNIGTEYAGPWVSRRIWSRKDFWRDTAVSVRGPAVKLLAESFIRTWRYVHDGGRVNRTEFIAGIDEVKPLKGKRLGRPSPQRLNRRNQSYQHHDHDPQPEKVGIFASAPTLASPLQPLLVRLFGEARTSIELTNPYFVPDPALVTALTDAASRGVRVRLMLLGEKGERPVVFAARSFYDRLFDAGCEVYERKDVYLHAKHLCVDGRTSLVGSCNLDYRSIQLNLELSMIIRSDAFGAQMHTLFEHDVHHSQKIDPDTWRQRPRLDRLVQWAVSRLRYLM